MYVLELCLFWQCVCVLEVSVCVSVARLTKHLVQLEHNINLKLIHQCPCV